MTSWFPPCGEVWGAFPALHLRHKKVKESMAGKKGAGAWRAARAPNYLSHSV